MTQGHVGQQWTGVGATRFGQESTQFIQDGKKIVDQVPQ